MVHILIFVSLVELEKLELLHLLLSSKKISLRPQPAFLTIILNAVIGSAINLAEKMTMPPMISKVYMGRYKHFVENA